MKKLIVCLLCLTAAVLCFAGCQSAKNEESEIKCDKNTVTVTLDENATTGFTWAYAIDPQDGLTFVKDEYILENTDEGVAGAGGQHVFEFKAEKPGEVTLKFEYARNWENVEPEDTRTYQLKIDDQLNVELN